MKLGNFVAASSSTSIKINSDVIFAGKDAVTIKAGTHLTTYLNAYIHLDPVSSVSRWVQKTNSTFDPDSKPNVKFGVWGWSGAERTFEIKGPTTWYNLVCVEPAATLKFSNYSDVHRVSNYFFAAPWQDSSGAPDTNHAKMINFTRLDDKGPIPSGSPDWVPPEGPQGDFWYFVLEPAAEMYLNYVYLNYSFSANRIPLPRRQTVIWAYPYVYREPDIPPTVPPTYTNIYNLGNPRLDYGSGSTFTDVTIKKSYYNVNWLEANEFYYSFTEDWDGNGRIDRIRAQAAFDLTGGADSFDNFRVLVEGYEIDKSKGHNGYIRADEDSNTPPSSGKEVLKRDMIYIYLKEKDYSDTGARLTWWLAENTTLKDWATKFIVIELPNSKKLTTYDNAPPRLTHALTVPGAVFSRSPGTDVGEIYVQFSEPVTLGNVIITDNTGSGVSKSGDLQPVNSNRTEFIMPLNSPYTVPNLVTLTPDTFTFDKIRDDAVHAPDLRSDPNETYAYRFPSPKYPVDWKLLDYEEIRGNPALVPSVPFVVVSGNSQPETIPWRSEADRGNLNSETTPNIPSNPDALPLTHRVTDVLISVPPIKADDDRYFVWPIWARYREPANAESLLAGDAFWGQKLSDTGIIWQFNGKKYLEAEDIDLQVHRNSSLSGDPAPTIWFGLNVPDTYRARAVSGGYGHGNPGLWLPKDSSSRFVNLTPFFYGSAASMPAELSLSSGDNYGYRFIKSRDGYTSPTMLDFFFHLYGSPSDLFAARLDINPGDAIPPNWYQLVRPFSFEIHDITRQRSGVTILNNVINPNNGESTYVHYQLVRGGQVTIQVFTLDGNMVDILYRGHRDAGEYRAVWGGKNRGGRAVARGMYFIRVVGPDIDEIRKVMVVK
ncbi:MAG: hypothetical protein LBS48_02305 [Treponema sp.]|nr:hypothetical protein [Treponema sp.]